MSLDETEEGSPPEKPSGQSGGDLHDENVLPVEREPAGDPPPVEIHGAPVGRGVVKGVYHQDAVRGQSRLLRVLLQLVPPG